MARRSQSPPEPASDQGGLAGLLQPPSIRRLHDSIARNIGIRIVSGSLRPGDLLSGEIEAAEQLDVSRTAYREAVRILAAKGMVESRTRTGTRVTPRPRWHILDPEVLTWFVETRPSDTFVRNLFELRLMIEPYGAALAARHHSRRDIEEIGDALGTMARLRLSTEEGRAADRAFHHAILVATRNELLTALSPGVSVAIYWTTLFKQREHREPRDPVAEHRLVFDAIRAGDADAARATMEDLVRHASADMEQAMSARPRPDPEPETPV